MKTLTWQKPGQQNVAQELIKIIINYVAELRLDRIGARRKGSESKDQRKRGVYLIGDNQIQLES